jgi:hypothetical protein
MNSIPLGLLMLFMAESAAERMPAACEVGAEVPSFFVREVTGERPNLATCLVCRYGNRPVVLVCVRKLDAAAEKLLEAIDRAVDEGRGVGLKGFAIFLAEKPADVQPRLMALVRQRGVTLPLTMPVENDGPKLLRPPAEAGLAVLCYTQRKVVAAHILLPGEITAGRIERVLADVQDLTQQ